MSKTSMDLVWIVVKDLKQALQFYTDVVGLEVMEYHEQFGWAELAGEKGGARLGIAQMQAECDEQGPPGQNAVMTFTVENIEMTVATLKSRGIRLFGEICEVPGHVKMQMAADQDGNRFQFVQVCKTPSKQHHQCAHC